MPSLEYRFWSKVLITPTCWLWKNSLNTDGYGQIWVNELGRNEGAHKVSWQLHNGPIEDSLWVLHECDNRKCVRPDHLYLGTALDNATDKKIRGAYFGEDAGHVTLVSEQVLSIVEQYESGAYSQRQLAREYGVSQRQIHRIVHGQTWKHLIGSTDRSY